VEQLWKIIWKWPKLEDSIFYKWHDSKDWSTLKFCRHFSCHIRNCKKHVASWLKGTVDLYHSYLKGITSTVISKAAVVSKVLVVIMRPKVIVSLGLYCPNSDFGSHCCNIVFHQWSQFPLLQHDHSFHYCKTVSTVALSYVACLVPGKNTTDRQTEDHLKPRKRIFSSVPQLDSAC
jgi:hypothetical protein